MSRRIWVGVLVANERSVHLAHVHFLGFFARTKRAMEKVGHVVLQFHFYVSHSIKVSWKSTHVMYSSSLCFVLLRLNNSVAFFTSQCICYTMDSSYTAPQRDSVEFWSLLLPWTGCTYIRASHSRINGCQTRQALNNFSMPVFQIYTTKWNREAHLTARTSTFPMSCHYKWADSLTNPGKQMWQVLTWVKTRKNPAHYDNTVKPDEEIPAGVPGLLGYRKQTQSNFPLVWTLLWRYTRGVNRLLSCLCTTSDSLMTYVSRAFYVHPRAQLLGMALQKKRRITLLGNPGYRTRTKAKTQNWTENCYSSFEPEQNICQHLESQPEQSSWKYNGNCFGKQFSTDYK